MDLVNELPRRVLFLVSLLFQLQGIYGLTVQEEDFRFCATRNHTQKSSIYYKKHGNFISIENHPHGLYISAPFLPEDGNYYLKDRNGLYRFCVYGQQATGLFRLHYGNRIYNLSTEAKGFLCSSNVSGNSSQGSGKPSSVLHSVSYAYNKGSRNQSLPDSSAYKIIFHESGSADKKSSLQVCEVEKELEDLAVALEYPISGRRNNSGTFYHYLQRLDTYLGKMDFKEESRTLGKGRRLRASVWNVLPHKASLGLAIHSKPEENKEVRGIDVTLPSILFATTPRGRKQANPKVVFMEVSSQNQTLFQPHQNSGSILGEVVFGISVADRQVSGLPKEQRVALTFWHNRLLKNATPQCVFWDTSSNAGQAGFWNTSGSEVKAGRNHTICLWDHLTFFAVLMTSSPDLDHIHQNYLTVITYFGCVISALASFFTVCYFLCSRKNERDSIVHIHMNLLWAIFLLDVSFLIAVPLSATENDVACKAGAMFLHFGLLACLTWMGIEGYSLYRLVIEVFDFSTRNFLLKLCLVGWGLPLFLVTMILAVDQSSYGPYSIKVYETSDRYTNATICWITNKHINSILNLGYLSLVLLFNIIMLAAMVRVILKLRHWDYRQWQYAVMLLGLSCVLGIPWGLAFFSFTFGTFKLVSLYLFTIINSFQGFLIFLWYLAKIVQARRSASAQLMSSNSGKLHSSSSML
ncbi:PREDICTED: G-protein coupled receptor 56 [Gekko japonicus]|uniref:Adhesion G-protein coupled receptor G1 n=1 Tax=Gekko japonicus TaxID=146911 RepID=A0ABM1K3M1_GEKJA|nr:PREDICTED: G-protein coupled receptor 56 [Gekko japonicus]